MIYFMQRKIRFLCAIRCFFQHGRVHAAQGRGGEEETGERMADGGK
jgi:hypothetical protein